MTSEVTIEQMKEELLAAGWRAMTRYMWRNPSGKLFLGPAGAWKIMRRLSSGIQISR